MGHLQRFSARDIDTNIDRCATRRASWRYWHSLRLLLLSLSLSLSRHTAHPSVYFLYFFFPLKISISLSQYTLLLFFLLWLSTLSDIGSISLEKQRGRSSIDGNISRKRNRYTGLFACPPNQKKKKRVPLGARQHQVRTALVYTHHSLTTAIRQSFYFSLSLSIPNN